MHQKPDLKNFNYLDQQDWVFIAREDLVQLVNNHTSDQFEYRRLYVGGSELYKFGVRGRYVMPNTPQIMLPNNINNIGIYSNGNLNIQADKYPLEIFVQKATSNLDKLIKKNTCEVVILQTFKIILRTIDFLIKKYGLFRITYEMIKVSNSNQLLIWPHENFGEIVCQFPIKSVNIYQDYRVMINDLLDVFQYAGCKRQLENVRARCNIQKLLSFQKFKIILESKLKCVHNGNGSSHGSNYFNCNKNNNKQEQKQKFSKVFQSPQFLKKKFSPDKNLTQKFSVQRFSPERFHPQKSKIIDKLKQKDVTQQKQKDRQPYNEKQKQHQNSSKRSTQQFTQNIILNTNSNFSSNFNYNYNYNNHNNNHNNNHSNNNNNNNNNNSDKKSKNQIRSGTSAQISLYSPTASDFNSRKNSYYNNANTINQINTFLQDQQRIKKQHEKQQQQQQHIQKLNKQQTTSINSLQLPKNLIQVPKNSNLSNKSNHSNKSNLSNHSNPSNHSNSNSNSTSNYKFNNNYFQNQKSNNNNNIMTYQNPRSNHILNYNYTYNQFIHSTNSSNIQRQRDQLQSQSQNIQDISQKTSLPKVKSQNFQNTQFAHHYNYSSHHHEVASTIQTNDIKKIQFRQTANSLANASITNLITSSGKVKISQSQYQEHKLSNSTASVSLSSLNLNLSSSVGVKNKQTRPIKYIKQTFKVKQSKIIQQKNQEIASPNNIQSNQNSHKGSLHLHESQLSLQKDFNLLLNQGQAEDGDGDVVGSSYRPSNNLLELEAEMNNILFN